MTPNHQIFSMSEERESIKFEGGRVNQKATTMAVRHHKT